MGRASKDILAEYVVHLPLTHWPDINGFREAERRYVLTCQRWIVYSRYMASLCISRPEMMFIWTPDKTRTLFAKPAKPGMESTHITSGSRDRTIRIWDAETGAVIGEPRVSPSSSRTPALSYSFSDSRGPSWTQGIEQRSEGWSQLVAQGVNSTTSPLVPVILTL